jgi:hypothetical protein
MLESGDPHLPNCEIPAAQIEVPQPSSGSSPHCASAELARPSPRRHHHPMVISTKYLIFSRKYSYSYFSNSFTPLACYTFMGKIVFLFPGVYSLTLYKCMTTTNHSRYMLQRMA